MYSQEVVGLPHWLLRGKGGEWTNQNRVFEDAGMEERGFSRRSRRMLSQLGNSIANRQLSKPDPSERSGLLAIVFNADSKTRSRAVRRGTSRAPIGDVRHSWYGVVLPQSIRKFWCDPSQLLRKRRLSYRSSAGRRVFCFCLNPWTRRASLRFVLRHFSVPGRVAWVWPIKFMAIKVACATQNRQCEHTRAVGCASARRRGSESDRISVSGRDYLFFFGAPSSNRRG